MRTQILHDFSKINKYYQPNSTTGFIDLTTKVTTLYDHNHEPINYLLINVDKTEDTIAYNKIQEFESFFDLVGDYAKVGYAHFDALSRDGYALRSWYRKVPSYTAMSGFAEQMEITLGHGLTY